MKALTKPIFENTVDISHRDDFLIIKPRYAPLIPSIIIRGIIGCMAIWILINVIPHALNHQRLDEEMLTSLLLIFLSSFTLWTMFHKTRKSLIEIAVSVTIFGKAHQEVTIGKHIRIPFGEIIGIRLTNEQISDNIVMISIKLITQDTEQHICSPVHKQQELSRNLHRYVKLILMSLMRSTDNLSDYLIQIDPVALEVKKGYSEDIMLKRK